MSNLWCLCFKHIFLEDKNFFEYKCVNFDYPQDDISYKKVGTQSHTYPGTGYDASKAVDGNRERVWGQKQLVLTQLTRWCGGKWILAGSITFTISTSCSKNTTVLVRNHMICFFVFYASNKFSNSNFFIKLQECKITSTIFYYNFLKFKWVRFKIREMLLAISHE